MIMSPAFPPAVAMAALLCLAPASDARAQYKVVGPDGRVSYSDRPPSGADAGSRVSNLSTAVAGTTAGTADPFARLPAALRPAASRFPVTLYTGSDCEPCARARQLLRGRGIPYAERTVVSDADAQALQRLTGATTVPALGVGQQILRGLLDTEWHATLDLAGYPPNSVLPADWSPGPAQPLLVATPRPAAPATPAAENPRPSGQPSPSVAPPARSSADPAAPGIRF